MNFTRKNIIPFIIIGILVSGIPIITLCSFYCISGDLDSSMDANCPLSNHSFVQIAIMLFLPFAGLCLVRNRQLIPPGIYLCLFKPPRSFH